MAIFRIVAWLLVAVALMLLGADGISTLEAGEPVVRTTAEILSLLGLQMTPPESGVMKFVLEAPMWMFFGIVGIVLTLIFRPID
ncbi:hypothetical protein [Parvularcula sp. LCG005]|uniref:hypothetical protein n=1 Tax=Parvularcula sp. LCG005 TaxID=3078805 RepID=UPI002943DBE4|nr:hypothetical protein [Parvularcula sp. LCG005]WOI53102.1 hypothetical protein RUI03_13200 [Parvularcula sp. LCG005]